MHGLVNRSLERFARDTYGAELWNRVAAESQTGFESFEAMLIYDDAVSLAVIAELSKQLTKPETELLEDVGTYLVSHENMAGIRRLLRFSGNTFIDFLMSLEDLKGRVELALPDLDFPRLRLREHAPGRYNVLCHAPHSMFSHVLVGVLRAMADDYGALVFLNHLGTQAGAEVIAVEVVETEFSDGRAFHLSERIGSFDVV